MNKRMLINRIIAFLMMLVMMVSVCPHANIDVEAKSKDSEKDWGQVYIDYIFEYHRPRASEDGPFLRDSVRYELIYLDDDNIPEILFFNSDGTAGTGIIYLKDGKPEYRIISRYSFNYIEYSGLIFTEDSGMDAVYSTVYKFENGSFETIASGHYGYAQSEKQTNYVWEDKNVSETEYQKELNKCFDQNKGIVLNNSDDQVRSYYEIIVDIQRESIKYSDIDWISAYQKFLVNREYLELVKDFGYETEIYGKFFDMDHDGIPELILDNGYYGWFKENGLLFSYTKGKIVFLGSIINTNFVDYTDGFSGSLYGLLGTSAVDMAAGGELYKYVKNGDEIQRSLIEEYHGVTNDYTTFRDYRNINNRELFMLVSELSVYDNLVKDGKENLVGDIVDISDLVSGLGWAGGKYDYRDSDYNGFFTTFFNLNMMNDLKKYPGNIMEYSSYEYKGYEKEPKNRFKYGYTRKDGEGTDWVLQNIYNKSEAVIEDLHKKDDTVMYYYNNDYYADYIGDGGSYNSFIEKIENLGGVYMITYYQILHPSEARELEYDKKYALVADKKIDGVHYWSLYRVSDTPFTQEDADNIGVGFEINYHYKPYKIIALKAKSNGCYVTCDIGNRKDNGKGEYEHYDLPELHMDATNIGAYEMFELIPCSNGSYALRSVMNRKYLTKNVKYDAGRHSYVYKDFIDDACQLDLDLNSAYTKLKFRNSGDYMCYGASIFRQLLEPGLDSSKAEEFEIVVLKEDEYEGWEKNILTSGEWYHLNGENGGYWDIQNEIGLVNGDNVKTLKEQDYYLMQLYGKGNGTIEVQNMQCAVGVKYKEGIYDVIVTFQGTSGYAGEKTGDDFWDGYKGIKNNVLDIIENIKGYEVVGCHAGYKTMADNLIAVESVLTAKNMKTGIVLTDKKTGIPITLKDLIKKAKTGKAKFTILGHSMGGAIAQIYGLHLFNCGIPASQIRGRTFNSALAFTVDTVGDQFTDWFNIGVSSDSVVNGNVTGAINKHGIHRLGKTIWLYDDESEKNSPNKLNNIDNSKHVMDGKLKTILDDVQNLNQVTYKGYHKVSNSDLFVTNKYNVPVYDRPKKDSDPSDYIDEIHTVVDIESYTYNDVGNKWYKTKDGKFIYSGNIEVLKKQSIGWSILPHFIIASDRAPLRAGCYNDTDVIERVKKDTAIDVDYAVKNGGGNVWYHATVNGNTGWIYSNHVQRGISEKKIVDSINWLLAIDCPVNISLYTSDDELAASIIDGEVYTADKKAINPYVIGDGKYFEVYDDEQYYVEIDSLADGMMDYTIYRDYDAKVGEFKEIKKFEAVDLSEEQYFDSTIGGDISAEDVELKVVDEDGQILSFIGTEGMPVEDTGFFNKKNTIIVGASAAGLVMLTSIVLICRKKRKKTKGNYVA